MEKVASEVSFNPDAAPHVADFGTSVRRSRYANAYCTGAGRHCHPSAYSDGNSDCNAGADGDPDCNSRPNGDPNCNSEAASDSSFYVHSCTHPGSDPSFHSGSDPDAHASPDPRSDARTGP